MDKKISIIIPAYNVEAYLCNTLQSVLAQTYENIEVIVVNDGSTDGTGAVADAFARKDSRVKVIHKENGGVTSARLRGLAEATGGWLGFVDGDDFVEPGMYERLLENALRCGADISHCGYRMVFPNGKVDYYYNTGALMQQDHLTGLKELLLGERVEPSLCCKLFRRELAADLESCMDRSVKHLEDLLMNYYLFRNAASTVLEDVCPYHYLLRQGSASKSARSARMLLDPLRVTKTILAGADPALQGVLLTKLTRQLVALATMSAGDQPELILPIRKECRKELRSRLRRILRCGEVGIKLKIMAVWAAIWPASYAFVHNAYARFTGLDKKYDLTESV